MNTLDTKVIPADLIIMEPHQVLYEAVKMRKLLQRINEVGFVDSYERDEALGDISNYINLLPK